MPDLWRPRPSDGDHKSPGFVLIVVLWTLVLIAFITAHLAASGRTEARIAANLVANAGALAAADGAIYQAIFDLSDPRPDHRWALDRAPHDIDMGGSHIVVRVENEAARINLNVASPKLVEALLRACGRDPESAKQLASTIAQWVGTATDTGAGRDLPDSGNASGPSPGAPLETIDELARVPGMSPEIFAAIRPHLTVFGPATPDRAGADPIVAAALAMAGDALQSGANIIPYGDSRIVRITSTAQGPRGASLTRMAVVSLGAQLPNGYTVLAWEKEADR